MEGILVIGLYQTIPLIAEAGTINSKYHSYMLLQFMANFHFVVLGRVRTRSSHVFSF